MPENGAGKGFAEAHKVHLRKERAKPDAPSEALDPFLGKTVRLDTTHKISNRDGREIQRGTFGDQARDRRSRPRRDKIRRA